MLHIIPPAWPAGTNPESGSVDYLGVGSDDGDRGILAAGSQMQVKRSAKRQGTIASPVNRGLGEWFAKRVQVNVVGVGWIPEHGFAENGIRGTFNVKCVFKRE